MRRRRRRHEERLDEELRFLSDDVERTEPLVPSVEHELERPPADADDPRIEAGTRA